MRKLIAITAVVASALGLAACHKTPTPSQQAAVDAVHFGINAARANAGVGALSTSNQLLLADGQDEANRVHNDSPNNGCVLTHDASYSNLYCLGGPGSNVCTASEAAKAVTAWLNSTGGHREVMLDPGLNYMGAGVSCNDGVIFVAASFAS